MEHHYFLAVFPSAEERDKTARIATILQPLLALRGSLIDHAKLHLTLHFLGRYEQPNAELEAAVATTCSWIEADRFDVTFDRATSFEARRALAPCVFEPSIVPAALLTLADQVQGATGVAREQDFRPHVTWLYSRDRIATPARIESVAWACTAFSLVHSGPDGEYRILRTWSLA